MCRIPFLILLIVLSGVAVPAAFAQSESHQDKASTIAPPIVAKQLTGDLDVLLKRRVIKMGVQYSKTFFYTVKGVQYGIAHDLGKEFEAYLNKKYPPAKKNIKIHVVLVVTPRDKAGSYLAEGKLDILAGGLIITPERRKVVDFSETTVKNVHEIVVTAPGEPKLTSVDDLSDREVFVRKTSAYWEHLERLNQRFQAERKRPVNIRAVPDDLADEDILEMVNAGLLPATVMAEWTTTLWKPLLPKLQIYPSIVVESGLEYGWAVRKNSPRLLAAINDFIGTHRQFGNQLVNTYVRSSYKLKQAVSPEAMKSFERTAQIFRKYSDEYKMDYLLVMAQGYQESGLNQQAKSQVGAIGVMQLMPATGKEMHVGDITQEDANIHAGVKYLNTTMNALYGNEPIDELNKVLFTFAAYNCGPARVKRLRAEAAQKGLDPNVWLNNVEFVAADRVGQETVNYVSNIYKYYVAYKLIAASEEERRKARAESAAQKQ